MDRRKSIIRREQSFSPNVIQSVPETREAVINKLMLKIADTISVILPHSSQVITEGIAIHNFGKEGIGFFLGLAKTKSDNYIMELYDNTIVIKISKNVSIEDIIFSWNLLLRILTAYCIITMNPSDLLTDRYITELIA